ncbi:MAG: PLDc N-terminal domain-containing protein [Planctomycetes bacterium]|nr:PLDc N-terminal domain-containing protein [Planctomycetota bacterium]
MIAALASEPSGWQALALGLFLVGEALAIVFVYRALVRGGAPASTLLWVLVILAAPWFGLLLYYLFPRRLHLRKLKRLRVRGVRWREVRPGRCAPAEAAAVPPGGLAALLAGADGRGLVPGNTLAWLPTGAEFERAAQAAIAAATDHVHCVVYILRGDAAGRRFLAMLTAAAKRGCKVRLLFDGFGSLGLANAELAPLRAAGGVAVPFLPLLWKKRPFTLNLRNHRKVLLVDGSIAFVGGRNVGDEYFTDRVGQQRAWLDAMLELRGPAVDRLQEVFVRDWHTATDEVLTDTFALPVPCGLATVGVVDSGPDKQRPELWFALIQAIGEARESIDMSSPYLVPPPTLLFALQLAAARGVAVRIWTNGPKAEAAILYRAQRSWYPRFLEAGVAIHETVRDYDHAKFLLVDDRVVSVGSANMDQRSAFWNFEIAAVVLDDPVLAAAVRATIDERARGFRRITAADLPRRPWTRALDALCGLLSPVL